MGKGKGSFDHWASRIAVSKIIFEIKGDVHEQVARDAFRLAGNKMPGRQAMVVRCCKILELTCPQVNMNL
jgi:ribosomal protein L16/L10AE